MKTNERGVVIAENELTVYYFPLEKDLCLNFLMNNNLFHLAFPVKNLEDAALEINFG